MLNMTMESDRMTFTFPGRMDTLACEKYESQIETSIGGSGRPVTFDLTGVTYVASSFLRICLKTVAVAGKDRFELVHVCPEIKKVFKIAGLDQQLSVR